MSDLSAGNDPSVSADALNAITLQKLRKMRTGNAPLLRRFDQARVNALTNDWVTSDSSIDTDLFNDLEQLIRRSRNLAQNNEYAAGFLAQGRANVLDPKEGFKVQLGVRNPNGELDDLANDAIESKWREWTLPENCTTAGNLSFRDVMGVALDAILRDGAAIIRIWRGASAGKHRIALQLYDIDHLDVRKNEMLSNGNTVRMGVEQTPMGKVVAYHLKRQHPHDYALPNKRKRYEYERVPASQIIHPFIAQRPGQTRGYPAFAPVLFALWQLQKYKEYELVAARIGAEQLGILERDAEQIPNGYGADLNSNDNIDYEEISGAGLYKTPQGFKFKPWDTTHPNQGYGDFVKECLRGIGYALGVSYGNFANDRSDSSFSAERAAQFNERAHWKTLQEFLINHVVRPIFTKWLDSALMAGVIVGPAGNAFPYAGYNRFNKPRFIGRRWETMDPSKEVPANVTAMRNGLTSANRILAQQGYDEDEILSEIERTKERRDQLGLNDPDFKNREAQPAPQGQPERARTQATRELDEDEPRLEQSEYARPARPYVQDLKDNWPDIWKSGGNDRGNDAFDLWSRYADGDRSETVIDWVREREAWAARHFENGAQFNDADEEPNLSNIGGIVAQLKWGVVGTLGERKMRRIINTVKRKTEED